MNKDEKYQKFFVTPSTCMCASTAFSGTGWLKEVIDFVHERYIFRVIYFVSFTIIQERYYIQSHRLRLIHFKFRLTYYIKRRSSKP